MLSLSKRLPATARGGRTESWTASGDRSAFGKKPTAGLAAIMSAKSCSECAEVRMTLGASMGVGAVQLLGEIEPAFAAQIDVDQRDIRTQFFDPPDCLSDRRRDPDDRDPAALEQSRGYVNEHGVVIDDYAAQLVCPRRSLLQFRLRASWCHCG